MNCPNCNTPNQENARFCKNCGTALTFAPKIENNNSKQAILLLALFIGIHYVDMLAWFILQKIIAPFLFTKHGITDWEKVSPVYKVFGWISDIAIIIATLILSIVIKHKKARILLIVCLFLRIIFLIGYRLFQKI